MIKIWGRKNSINVQKVLWCCDELDIPYQRIDVGAQPGDVDTAAYRKLNPNGLIPTIEDGEFILWESNSILRYLASKYDDGNIWPTNPQARALADRWMDWQLGTLWVEMRPMFIQLIRHSPDHRDQSVIDMAYRKTLAAMKLLDAHLGNHHHVAGERFTLGDIPVGAVTYRWMALPIERPDLVNLQNWYSRLAHRSAYRQHVMQPMS
ncbi:MAG: glutathione S-transferase family protein [Gammaproteobacteria bacterium]|nr:glutathione S-transferase family protein [Gammaproteobacteria bacterium]